MTKAEKKQIDAEMRELADRARTKVANLCSSICAPYQLAALEELRRHIDIQIEAIKTYLAYANDNKL